jgi:adenosylcobyric acid synthase
MGFAEAADLPVALIGDVDRGGVIASLVGTFALLEDAERARLKAVIINKFRGDPALFTDALEIIRSRTGAACLGVVPYFEAARQLPAEDAVALDGVNGARVMPGPNLIKIAVPRLARIANFDDLDPLRAEPDVALEIVDPGRALPGDADLVLLPGSKATRSDLAYLHAQGWGVDIAAHLRRGGWLIGLCGGYQMLGCTVADPEGSEGAPGISDGLGLLAVDTTLTADKTLTPVIGHDTESGEAVSGYEMHTGVTDGPDRARPMLILDGGPEGARSADGRVRGCYVHGLFAADGFRHAFLNRLKRRAQSGLAYEALVDETLDGLAHHLEQSLNLDAMLELARA